VNPDKDQWYKALPTAQYATKMGGYSFLPHHGNRLQILRNPAGVTANFTSLSQIMLLMHSISMTLVLI